jgi:glutathionylspermidine amidase/synthetase
MPRKKKPVPAPFGSLLGHAPGGVPVYSSDYDTVDESEFPNRRAYRSVLDGIDLGFKWQCVEFARRWLYLNRGQVFDDVPMAYDIFRLRSVRDVATGQRLPLHAFRNGSKRHPEPGSLLVWDEGGEFETTGHVAVVTEVTPEFVRVAEQNVGHHVWPEGRDYSREIRARATDDGELWLECSFGDATILGWLIQTDDDEYAERFEPPAGRLFRLQDRELEPPHPPERSWLNIANEDEAAYVAMMGGHKLSANDADRYRYYALSRTAHEELEHATIELHSMFLHATDWVLRDDERLARFNFPPALWPRIHQSWDNRRNQMITGRFDFAVTEAGIRVYEYNCDSASCHMETGKVQGKWADYYGCDEGSDPGEILHATLRDTWRRSDVDDVLHIMQDNDLEETYHVLFMQEAMEEAGIQSKILHGMAGLGWDAAGNVVDADGLPIRWVWKTWAWETALDQLKAECEGDEVDLESLRSGRKSDAPPRLVDVLLRPNVLVYEPLWTLIPSNKAILPVLWQLFPNHPYLLESRYELTDELRAKGYVVKPIVGRGGSNITLYDRKENVVAETAGRFDDRDQIYQELFRLPHVGGYNVQVSTFSAGGRYAGSCVRVDESPVINMQSDNIALRILDDEEFE